MPKRPQRPCSYPGCPNRCDGQYCEEHAKVMNRRYNKFVRSADSNKKYGRAWREIRKRYAAAHPLCEMCLKKGRLTPVEEVHVNAELEKPCITKAGDLWLLGNHRLVCGDSTKLKTYEFLMDGKKANLTVTDPPYNVNYEGSAGKIKNEAYSAYRLSHKEFKHEQLHCPRPVRRFGQYACCL